MRNEAFNVLGILKDKHSGTTGTGEKIYSNITEQELKKIISQSVMYTVGRIKKTMENGSDEWDTIDCVSVELDTLTQQFDTLKKKKPKIK